MNYLEKRRSGCEEKTNLILSTRQSFLFSSTSLSADKADYLGTKKLKELEDLGELVEAADRMEAEGVLY